MLFLYFVEIIHIFETLSASVTMSKYDIVINNKHVLLTENRVSFDYFIKNIESCTFIYEKINNFQPSNF